MTQTPWLWRCYIVALAVYGILFAFLLFGAALWAFSMGATADAAPSGGIFALLGFVTMALPALIALVPLASFALLRRRGLWPSPGHQTIAVIGAVLFAGLILITGLTT